MQEAKRVTLLSQQTISAAATTNGTAYTNLSWVKYLAIEAIFLYGAGGTATKCYIQTSLDGGTTWIDIACLTFTTAAASKVSAVNANIALAASVTPGNGALSDDTILNGLLGDRIRAKVVTTGTYTGATSIAIYAVVKE